MPQSVPICLKCEHYIFARRCEAFKKIPDKIWLGESDHKENVDGDNGIKFERIDK